VTVATSVQTAAEAARVPAAMPLHAVAPGAGVLGEDALLVKPIQRMSRGFHLAAAALTAVALFGLFMYCRQLWFGLGVTGLNQPVSWGFYVTNFVFFIGISHAGTLISAILRIAKAEWRRPITRIAEVITVVVLGIGGMNILIDMGRPDRFLNVIKFGRYQSPLLWDATSITTYLTGSVIYLYIPLIPDIAILRDTTRGRLRWLYRVLSMGWRGTHRQHQVLERAISIMAVLVIPIAVSVHTVVSFVFSMTLQPMWHSTIFGPYFVVGAIFSGVAALLICMAIIRKAYGLERYLKLVHFNNLAILLLVMSMLWFYFTFAEYLTTYYGNEPDEMRVFMSKFDGPYAVFFWGMVVCNFAIPFPILAIRRLRTIPGIVVASAAICIGMWLERFIIVVPTLANPRMDFGPGFYSAMLTEAAETAGCFSVFILAYMVFTKVFPIISIWEIQEGRTSAIAEVVSRVRAGLPDAPEPEGARP